MKNNFEVCPYDGGPCFRGSKCFLRVTGDAYRPYYACVRIRFKGANSIYDPRMGMTIYEKLKRQGLLPK